MSVCCPAPGTAPGPEQALAAGWQVSEAMNVRKTDKEGTQHSGGGGLLVLCEERQKGHPKVMLKEGTG